MPVSKFPLTCLLRIRMLPLLAGLWLAAGGEGARAATIGTGDVTVSLGPTFFVDDAVAGGSIDVTVTQPAVGTYNRSFAGLLNANQGLSRVTLTGFGFATSTAAPPTNNTATTLTVTFTYLGADEMAGGGDDVAMGSASGTYAYTTNGEYVFAFDTPITATLNITGVRFQIQVTPSNGTSNGKVLFKAAALTYETATGPKFSVAGIVAPQRVNLAKYQLVTADSVNGQRLATYLTDGVVGNDNRWQSDNTGPHWAQVTFPFPVQVGSAQVFSGVDDINTLTNFKIQYLSNVTWLDAPGASVTGNTNIERNVVFTSPVTASSFRIYSTVATMQIKELALYPPNGANGYPLGTDLTLDLAYQRPAVSSTNTTGNFALLAVDGRVNKDSKWQTSTAGAQSLEIDLRVSSKIGSAHLYSGSPGVAALAAFVLRYWDGAAWQDIPGGTVAGNTTADLVIPFSSTVTTSKVRLEFTNAGTTSVRELCIFPANFGNTGYPIGTGVIGAPPSTTKYDDYHDAFYNITNPTAGKFIAVSNGIPGLSQPGLTTVQGQYQVLLNVGSGTYRLRNQATGYCLSGAQLSTTPGAALLDAPYSALPDQDWILDPISGTSFLLINQWSGLVIDTQGGATAAGTPLVQNANTGAASQRWQMVYSAHYPKKGIGGTGFAYKFDINWAYNWSMANSQGLPAGAVFNPMQWGSYNWDIGSEAGPPWQYYPAWRRRAAGIHHMGFNEPDGFDQSGKSLDNFPATEAAFSRTRSMTEAVRLWPRLQAMDMPLVSPAPANKDNGWLASFYTQAAALGYRVDYTAVHTYPSPNSGSSDDLFTFLTQAYNDWDRPVWLTEFSFVDWNKNSSWSEEDCYNCLAEFLWRAESLPWLRKYALFVFTEDADYPQPANPWSTSVTTGGAPRSNSRDINGDLTAFGELYAAWDNEATFKPDKTYYIHNKGTRKRLANTLASAPGGRSIRINDASVKWTLVPSPTSNQYYVTSTLDGRRLSSDGTTVSQAEAGTTGTTVQWGVTEAQYGWFYLRHPATSNERLKLVYTNNTGAATYSMVANTNTEDASQWRFIVPPPPPAWSGASGTSWTTAGSWIPNVVPSTGDAVNFNNSSTANLNTVLNQDFNLLGVTVTSPAGPVSIGGTNILTVGANGIDLSGASQNLTVTAPVVLGAAQSWSVASGRTLSLNGGLSGAFALNIGGAGSVVPGAAIDPLVPITVASGGTLKPGASGVLASGTSAVNPTINGTLDLNGTNQSVNTLTGSGVIDNTAPGAAQLTVGNNDAAVTLNALLQNSGGPLTLVKTGTGALTLPSSKSHSGGFTNNGTGNIVPQNSSAFGLGPVVMNAGTIYPILTYTFPNALTLNGGVLRIGGGAGKSITWTGPVSVTADSEIRADGSTSGVTLSNPVTMSGVTLSSFAGGGSLGNTISGSINGSGNIIVTSGTLNLNAANTFVGTFRASAASTFLKIGDALAMQNATLDMNAADLGSVNLNNLNATLGALTGSRNLALGSGTISIGNNHLTTLFSGVLSGAGSLVKTGNGTLTLSGANSYAGTTGVNAGTLALGAGSVLPSMALTIGNATLDAATFTDTVGTLDVTSTAKINLGAGAALAFANSAAIDWAGGSLSITGTFVPGVSLRFGTTSGGLTSTQLASITATGWTSFALNASGYLTATTSGGSAYDAWKATNAPTGDPNADFDGDGVSNSVEFVLGGDKNTNDLGKLPAISTSGGNMLFTFKRAQSSIDPKTSVSIEVGTNLVTWTTSYVVPDGAAAASPGVTVVKDSPATGTDTVTLSVAQVPDANKFACLKAVITP